MDTHSKTAPEPRTMKNAITIFLAVALTIPVIGQPPPVQWQRSLGGTNAEELFDVQQTADGGYVMTGYATSDDGDVTQVLGEEDVLRGPRAGAGERGRRQLVRVARAGHALSFQLLVEAVRERRLRGVRAESHGMTRRPGGRGAPTRRRGATSAPLPGATSRRDDVRATSRSCASMTVVCSVAGMRDRPLFATRVRTSTVALVESTSGVVTNVPRCATCTGPTVVSQTWR